MHGTILGKTGTGKTELVKIMIPFLYKWKNLIIVDVFNSYREVLPEDKWLYVAVNHINFDDMSSKAVILENIREAVYNHKALYFNIEDLIDEEEQIFLNNLSYILSSQLGYVLIIDEASRFLKRNATPEWIERLFKGGRHNDINLITIYQSFTDAIMSSLRQNDWIIAAFSNENNEKQRIKELFNIDLDLVKLDKYEFLIMYDGETGIINRDTLKETLNTLFD